MKFITLDLFLSTKYYTNHESRIMFGIGTTEIILILIIALIFLGPKKLPEIAKAIGKAIREFRKGTEDIKETIEDEIYKKEKKDIKPEKKIKQSNSNLEG